MTQVWQIAAGEKDRSYIDLFLNHDVMFMGPGRFIQRRDGVSCLKTARTSLPVECLIFRFEKT